MTKDVYLIHGTSTRDDDWFPWLEEAAAPQIKVHRLRLPHPFNPKRREWQQAISQQVPAQDGITLVAHSLGCIAALQFVAKKHLRDVNLILVAAFDQPLAGYPDLDNFILPAPNYQQLRQQIKHAVVFTAENEPIAPYQNAQQLADNIGAKCITKRTGGHFLTSDGYRSFPEVLQLLKEWQ